MGRFASVRFVVMVLAASEATDPVFIAAAGR
jgi:hypothetical protein